MAETELVPSPPKQSLRPVIDVLAKKAAQQARENDTLRPDSLKKILDSNTIMTVTQIQKFTINNTVIGPIAVQNNIGEKRSQEVASPRAPVPDTRVVQVVPTGEHPGHIIIDLLSSIVKQQKITNSLLQNMGTMQAKDLRAQQRKEEEDKFDEEEEKQEKGFFQGKFSNFFGRITGMFKNLVGLFLIFKALQATIAIAIHDFTAALSEAKDNAKEWGTSFEAAMLGTFIDKFTFGAIEGEKAAQSLQAAGNEIKHWFTVIGYLWEDIKHWLTVIGYWWEDFKRGVNKVAMAFNYVIGGQYFTDLKHGIEGIIMMVGDSLRMIFNPMVDAITSTLDAIVERFNSIYLKIKSFFVSIANKLGFDFKDHDEATNVAVDAAKRSKNFGQLAETAQSASERNRLKYMQDYEKQVQLAITSNPAIDSRQQAEVWVQDNIPKFDKRVLDKWRAKERENKKQVVGAMKSPAAPQRTVQPTEPSFGMDRTSVIGGQSISEEGLNLIKQKEGFRGDAYQDSVGVWTIGYGHTKGVKPGDKITEPQADALLRREVKEYEGYVHQKINVPLTQGQFDALTSFTYNLGPKNLGNIAQNLNRGDYEGAAERMLLYVKAGGETLRGLEIRRQQEVNLFNTPGRDIVPLPTQAPTQLAAAQAQASTLKSEGTVAASKSAGDVNIINGGSTAMGAGGGESSGTGMTTGLNQEPTVYAMTAKANIASS